MASQWCWHKPKKTHMGQQRAPRELSGARQQNMDYATLSFWVMGTASLTPESRTLNHQSTRGTTQIEKLWVLPPCSETHGSSAHQQGGRSKINNFPAQRQVSQSRRAWWQGWAQKDVNFKYSGSLWGSGKKECRKYPSHEKSCGGYLGACTATGSMTTVALGAHPRGRKVATQTSTRYHLMSRKPSASFHHFICWHSARRVCAWWDSKHQWVLPQPDLATVPKDYILWAWPRQTCCSGCYYCLQQWGAPQNWLFFFTELNMQAGVHTTQCFRELDSSRICRACASALEPRKQNNEESSGLWIAQNLAWILNSFTCLGLVNR